MEELDSPNFQLSGDFDFITYLPYLNAPNKELLLNFVRYMYENNETDIRTISKHFRCAFPRMINLYITYLHAIKQGVLPLNRELLSSLSSFQNRVYSGVLVFTCVLSDKPLGQNFTCKNDCFYCPNFPGYSRSYVPGEPAVDRGYSSRNSIGERWDPVKQMHANFVRYLSTGQIDPFVKSKPKVTLILEGGTWNAYPQEYRAWFVTSCYYAANTIFDSLPRREMLSLQQEIEENKFNECARIVELSIETRPDCVDDDFIKEARSYGVTKVQIGVQSIRDEVLKKVNRGCKNEHTKSAMKKLLDHGFKVQIHMMPGLPLTTPESDSADLAELISNRRDYGFDHVKIYPVMITEHTMIKKWNERGEYTPYVENESLLLSVLRSFCSELERNSRYDLRIERTIRDIPINRICGGCTALSAGNTIAKDKKCICIRCREIKGDKIETSSIQLKVRCHELCGGQEYFFSHESGNKILSFLRLRFPSGRGVVFSELRGVPIIREVHVYGFASLVGGEGQHIQHLGLGSELIDLAKNISRNARYKKLAVISGVGVIEYYKKKHSFHEGGVGGGGYLFCDL